jgi:hypothetical protein
LSPWNSIRCPGARFVALELDSPPWNSICRHHLRLASTTGKWVPASSSLLRSELCGRRAMPELPSPMLLLVRRPRILELPLPRIERRRRPRSRRKLGSCAPAARSSAPPPSPGARGSPGQSHGDKAGRVGHFWRLGGAPAVAAWSSRRRRCELGERRVPAWRERIEKKRGEQGIKRSGSLTDGSHLS